MDGFHAEACLKNSAASANFASLARMTPKSLYELARISEAKTRYCLAACDSATVWAGEEGPEPGGKPPWAISCALRSSSLELASRTPAMRSELRLLASAEVCGSFSPFCCFGS